MADPAPTQLPVQAIRDGMSWEAPSFAVRPARLSVVVVANLVDRIVSGAYSAGSMLPPEPALCQAFGVSRSVVREALKALQEKGLVTVQQGYGTLVADPEEWNLLDPVVLAAVVRHDTQRAVIDDLIGVRAVLEAGMAARAALLRTEDDLRQLRRLVGELEAAIEETPRYVSLDTQFHDEIMRISGNRLARAVVHSIHREARSSAGYNDHDVEDIRATHDGHRAIFEQIKAGDEDRTAEAMRAHIIAMWQRKRERAVCRGGSVRG
jgi:DNA-binding FadR family transcriptional regulator